LTIWLAFREDLVMKNLEEYYQMIDDYTSKTNEEHLRERMKEHLRNLIKCDYANQYMKSDNLLMNVLAGWSR
jgi:hypothetical protein